MSHSLVISVRLHEGWYHGSDPHPSPARLFQALIAGQGLRGPLTDDARSSLEFLESLEPPILATPSLHSGQSVVTYVPNNDLDSKQGDHRRIGEIRTQKRVEPRLFNVEIPFLFVWRLTAEQAASNEAGNVVRIADDLYQLGRTVDAAWAWAELVSEDEAAEMVQQHPGPVHQPGEGAGSVECPMPGSLATVIRRHADMSRRYGLTTDRKGQTFRRRAKPKWRRVNYQHRESFISFDLTDVVEDRHYRWPCADAVKLVEAVRDAAASRLKAAMPAREADIERTLVGRRPNGSNNGRASDRVRIIPLPSVGHEHADQQIRRMTVVVPSSCLLRADDVAWAFSGLVVEAEEQRLLLVRSGQNPQAKYYKIGSGTSASWQSVTPISLGAATRRRIEPDLSKRRSQDMKGAYERVQEVTAARREIRNALRHAGVTAEPLNVHLQREPFDANGLRVENFAEGTRFNKHSMWHAQIDFAESIPGPIVIGDGRFLGLGVMKAAVALSTPRVHAFAITGLAQDASTMRVCAALRRAVMSKVRSILPDHAPLPPFFTGHQPDGRPSESDTPHLYFACDLSSRRLFVIAPSEADRSMNADSATDLRTLELALRDLTQVKAGRDGVLIVEPVAISFETDHLFAPSRHWQSLTPYAVNRHSKRSNASDAIVDDVLTECERRHLPRPSVQVERSYSEPGVGLHASLTIEFKHPVSGPLLLGRTRHKGGGLFHATASAKSSVRSASSHAAGPREV